MRCLHLFFFGRDPGLQTVNCTFDECLFSPHRRGKVFVTPKKATYGFHYAAENFRINFFLAVALALSPLSAV